MTIYATIRETATQETIKLTFETTLPKSKARIEKRLIAMGGLQGRSVLLISTHGSLYYLAPRERYMRRGLYVWHSVSDGGIGAPRLT